jgi:WD40 repeat protein/SH3-like domain-containing protein
MVINGRSNRFAFRSILTFSALLLVVGMVAGITGTLAKAESQLRQSQPKPGLWEGPSVSFFVNSDGSIQNFHLRANMMTSWCTIEADELHDQPEGGLEFVTLYPEANYWYGDLDTHEERLARAQERGVSWPDAVETDDGTMIKAINIVGTFTSETMIEGTYRVNVCENQLFLHMEGFGVNDWSAAWVSATADTPTPRPTATLSPTEPPTPNLTATYDRLMADALATVTAASWTETPLPTDTPTATATWTPSPSYTPTATATMTSTATATATLTPSTTPSPTPTPIPPQKISAANVAWLEEKAWVRIFGDPEEIHWSTDGSMLVTSTVFTAALFDPANLQEEPMREKHTSGFVNAVAVSPDGVTAAYGDGENNVVLWNLQTDAETVLRGHTLWVESLAFSTDGTRLASGSQDGTVRIWDVTTGKELAFFTDYYNGVNGVAFRPDGQILAGVGSLWPDTGVRLWNTQTFEELPLLPTDDAPVCVAFSPDGRLLVAGEDADIQWYIWDAQTFDRILMLGQSTSEPEGGLCSVAFSPDSTLMATGGGDKLIHIWDVAAGSATFGQELATLRRHTDTIRALEFSPDGTMLASGGGHNDSTIRLWAISPDAPPTSETTSPSAVGTLPPSTPLAPTVQPSESQTPEYAGSVNQNVNLRAGPGTDFPIVATISPVASFVIEYRNESGDWLRVRIPGETVEIQAWIYAPLVTTTAPIGQLPVYSDAANNDPAPETEVVTTPAADDQAADTATCTVVTRESVLLFASPSLEDFTEMPADIDAGTELVLDAQTTDANGLVWYRTQDEQWVFRDMLFLGEAAPADCVSLPQVAP